MARKPLSKLPPQLPWRDFLRVLQSIGYELFESKPGSARVFYNPAREPRLVTFHEPHGKHPVAEGTLREYIRKLQLSKQEFLTLLNRA